MCSGYLMLTSSGMALHPVGLSLSKWHSDRDVDMYIVTYKHRFFGFFFVFFKELIVHLICHPRDTQAGMAQ